MPLMAFVGEFNKRSDGALWAREGKMTERGWGPGSWKRSQHMQRLGKGPPPPKRSQQDSWAQWQQSDQEHEGRWQQRDQAPWHQAPWHQGGASSSSGGR